MNRYLGLDALRFFAALWVMMRHGAMPPLTEGASKGDLPQLVARIWHGSLSGPAAVILFFVISGFCIHLPYAQGKRFDLGEFVLRRFVRVLLPMIAALALWRAWHGFGDFDKDWLGGVPAWSIVAELVYYMLYPLLRRIPVAAWKPGTLLLFLGVFVFAVTTRPRSNIDYPAWGYLLDWLPGLPVWMLGVLLAQSGPVLPDPSARRIWSARAVAVAIGSFTTWLAWQRHAGHHLTLNIAGLYAVWWMREELGWFRNRTPPRLFEWAGTWSYSIYLVHSLAFSLLQWISLPRFGHLADWLVKMAVVLSLSWVFHVCFERPSHALAQRLARAWLARPRRNPSNASEPTGAPPLAAPLPSGT